MRVPYLTNSGTLFGFKLGSEWILSTSDFSIVDDLFFKEDNEFAVEMVIEIYEVKYKIVGIHSYINRLAEPESPEYMIGSKYPYSLVLMIELALHVTD